MDSFEKHGLDDDAFGDKGLSSLRTFDAFREYHLASTFSGRRKLAFPKFSPITDLS